MYGGVCTLSLNILNNRSLIYVTYFILTFYLAITNFFILQFSSIPLSVCANLRHRNNLQPNQKKNMNDIAKLPASGSVNLVEASPEIIEPLQKREISRLKKCEDVIGRNLKEFFEVGKALATIKNDRLYREEYKTFEQYCKEKWDFGRKRAYQFINASDTFEKMSTIVDIPLPKNEAQIRPLLRVPEEKITQTWQEFIHENGAEAFSAKDISKFVKQKNGTPKTPKRKSNKNSTSKNQSLGLTFELSNLVKELKQISIQYQENESLQLIVEKLHDCSERIQDKCLCQ